VSDPGGSIDVAAPGGVGSTRRAAPRLRLLPFEPAHFGTLGGWFGSEREAVQWGGWTVSFPLGPDQCQAMLDEGAGPRPARLCWMASDGSRLMGHAQLGFDWRNGNALLSRVAVAPEARGLGLAVPMLRLVVDEAFARPEIERLELNVFAANLPAIRTYERLGFATEGLRRSFAKVGDERWDTAMMALLRPEWRAAGGGHDLGSRRAA
jgi:RimJ/RimL family protein N-acetyltransferase